MIVNVQQEMGIGSGVMHHSRSQRSLTPISQLIYFVGLVCAELLEESRE